MSPEHPAATGELPVLLITGAAGRVAGRLRPYLRGRYRLRLTDRTSVDSEPPDADAGEAAEPIIVGDLLDAGFTDEVVAGADAVLHLAGNPNPAATWSEVEPANVTATERVLAAAARHDVTRVVYGSSVHVAGQYLRDGLVPVDPAWPAHPCCPYGASKAAAETLCRLYATRYAVPTASLRIGMPLAQPDPARPFSLEAWVSLPDLADLTLAALDRGPVCGEYFAISANTRSAWRIDNAVRDLGYTPSDNAEAYAHLADPDAPAREPCFAP